MNWGGRHPKRKQIYSTMLIDHGISLSASSILSDILSETMLNHLSKLNLHTNEVLRLAIINKTLTTPAASLKKHTAEEASQAVNVETFLRDASQKVHIARKSRPSNIPSPPTL